MRTNSSNGTAQFSVSRQGTLVYYAGSADRTTQVPVSVDRAGRGTPLGAEKRAWGGVAVSPDGRYSLLWGLGVGVASQAWLLENARGNRQRWR